MASTYTSSLRIEKPGTGEQSGTWGTTVNTSYDLMEKAVAGYLSIAMADANVTLTTANGSSDQARNAVIELTGTNTATRQCIVPAVSKVYIVKNSTTQSVTVKTSGGTGPTILTGKTAVVYCDGTNVNLVGVAESNAISAISGVTPAADALPYFTSTTAAAVTTLTSYARTLLDDADAGTARATLGLTIGTNVQAFSSNLSTFAGIAPSANVQSFLGAADYAAMRSQLSLVVGTNVQAFNTGLAAIASVSPASDALPYFTGASTASVTTLTAFARTLLDDADAATARATLGVTDGGTALQAANNLSDLSNAATARTNLGVTATGNDTTYAYRANNLSDLPSASAARTNLGLGTAATQNTGTSGTNVPLLSGANTWSATQTISASTGLVLSYASGSQGATMRLAKPASGTTLAGDVTIDVSGDVIRIYEAGGAFRGFFGALTSAGSQSELATTSTSQTFTNKTLSSPTISGTVAGSPTATGAWTFSGSLITILRSGSAPAAAGDESLRVISTGGTNFNTAIGIVSGNAAEARILFGDSDDVDIGFITYLHTNNSLIIGTNNANAAIFSSAGALSVTGSITSAGTAVPTISSTDTLSNKTLSSPTVSGTVAGNVTWSGTQTYSNSTAFNGGATFNNSGGSFFVTNVAASRGLAIIADAADTVARLQFTNNAVSAEWAGISASSVNVMNLQATGGVLVNGVTAVTTTDIQTLTNKTLSSPTLSGTAAGNVTWSGAHTFQQSTDTTVTAQGGSGYGAFFARGSGTNSSYVFLGNATNGERSRIVVSDSRDFIISNDAGTTFHFVVTSSGLLTASGVAVPTVSSTHTLSNKTLSSPTLSGTAAGDVTWSGAHTFQQSTDTLVTAQGGSGYGAFYPRGSGTNSAYVFFGNSTNSERSRIYADNSRNFVVSNNSGSTNHFQVGPTGAITASGVAIPTISSTDTLTNKTLSSPTISGTVAGSFTFSGVPKFDASASVSTGGTIKGYFGIGTQVDGGSGTDMVVRGEDGISFSIAGSRYARLTASNFNSVVGITINSVSVPTISSTDTLTNKTLTSPTINGGTIQSRVQTSSETSGTLTSASANKHLALTGNITLNNSVFTADDKMTIDPGTAARTITRGAGCTMYVNGVDSATATLAANQMGGVHVRSASVFVLTGAVS